MSLYLGGRRVECNIILDDLSVRRLEVDIVCFLL